MDVSEVLPEYADAFSFQSFNRMQETAVPAVLNGDDNVVVSAPTASGKTAIAEAAICKTLDNDGTALFIAPMRALTNEKEDDWERFSELGYSVYVVTGERDLNPRRAERADILVMTPEKVDSATRKHDTHRYQFIEAVDCCVIDEVHLLDSERRGSALEVTVSRLRRLCAPRIVALSATMQNVEDVAAWLDAPPDATFEFGDDYRPVDLNADVRTYTHGENSFADKYRRLYRALDLAEPHLEEDGQTLVFVSSRQDTVRAAEKARDELAERDIPIGARGDYDFHQKAQQLDDDTLRKSVLDGVAFHHAGLSKNDRDLVEDWFRAGHIELLFSTSTLAWGVNLPARCVVIRDTKYHDPLEGEVEISPLDVLQMLGRAGRPGYDDIGYGWIVCDRADADRYRRLLSEGKPIESRLNEDIDAHLSAEIARGTIRDIEDVYDWLDTTFYAVRAQSSPEQYGDIEAHAQETLTNLVERGFVERGDDLSIDATALGRLASMYYLRLPTAERFHSVATAAPDEDALLRAVATAKEFDSVSARSDEGDAVDAVLGGRAESLDAGNRKVLAILEASMNDAVPGALRSDAWIIKQNALRLLAALQAFCAEFAGGHTANLARRVEARVDDGVASDAVGLTAIEGVGKRRAERLAAAGFTTPGEVAAADTAALSSTELAEGVADRIQDAAADCPHVSVDWDAGGQFPDSVTHGDNDMQSVAVRNEGGGERASVRVTVNGVEMTTTETYLADEETIPVGVFGGDADTLVFKVSVAFPDQPLRPVTDTNTVDIQ